MNDQERVPKINNPKVFGVRPDSEFILPITASGEKPFHYSALNLLKDLSINESNGTITGKITNKGRYEITLQVKNKYGKAERDIEVVVGENISLTPPMGWNHWNCWGPKIDEDKVRQAADSIIANSLKDHGWVYVNIDDGWQGQRDPKTKALQPNEKFKDMKALCDYVHSLGLKIGIYSTPWRKSYAGFAGGSADTEDGKILGDDDGHTIGKYHFEEQDAKQWAEWGIDYLKYDWNPIDLDSTKRMYKALRNSGRDIILSLSNSAPYDSIGEISKYAQCWRTTGDIIDLWESTDQWWQWSVKRIAFLQDKWIKYAQPGHWNDMDMLVVGYVGWGDPKPTRLTPDEQRSHVSLWSLLNSPLLLGCDLSRLDKFTLSLLTNDEVIGINQDSLGQQGFLIRNDCEEKIVVKKLEDGSKAVGLFNLGKDQKEIELSFHELNFKGKVKLRDLWEQ
ncbi:MAG: hypothetical protein QXI16_05240, partial [Sulfolobaceae archaeon]